jgi:hypothetical protein
VAKRSSIRTSTTFSVRGTEDPIMSLAKQTLDALSQDPDVLRLAREREDSRALYQIDLATSKRLGKAEGKAELLLALLGERFGPPSDVTRARIASATSEQLDAWAKRILTAATLDDVLAP